MPIVDYGGRKIPVKSVKMTMREQEAPSIRQGPGGRSDRLGVRQYKIQSLHKGIGVVRGSEAADNLRVRSSQGLQSHIPFSLTLPYVSTTQAALTATDISGYRAANRRVHSVNSTLGQSKLRAYYGLGTKLYRNTSDSNAALADTTLSLTDNITSMFEGVFNSTRYLALCTDGATNDISGTTDPTATPPVLSTIVSLNAGDWVTGYYMPTLGPGFNLFYGEIAGVSGLWYLPTNQALGTAPQVVVNSATRNIPSTTNATVSVTKSPTLFYNDRTGATSTANNWATLANLGASDNARATYLPTAASEVSPKIIIGGYYFNIPSASVITGISFDPEAQEDNGASDFFWGSTANSSGKDGLEIVLAGVIKNIKYNPSASELNVTTDRIDTVGGTTQPLAPVTGADVNDAGFGCALQVYTASTFTVAGNAGIDHVPCTVTYRPPGVQANIPRGGFIVGADPSDPHTLYIVAPELQDEEATINVPRILWKCAFTYDADGSRPVVTITKVNTGLSHVEAACIALGNIVVAGDTKSGTGKAIRHIRSDGTPVDLGFNSSSSAYTEAWGAVNLFGSGRQLIADMALEDATVAQSWLHFDGAWSPYGTRETITALPLAYANNPQICIELSTRYRFNPSGVNTNVTRTFQPRALLADPLYNNTTDVKADGVLTITLPELDLLGPEEADKMILTAWCLSRDVSATNTIRLRYSSDGGGSFSTWATFTSYGSKSTLATPVSFRSLILEIGLDHTAATANTPNGLPILIEGIAAWPSQHTWECEIDPLSAQFTAAFPGGIDDLWSTLDAMAVVNTLQAGTVSAPATWHLVESWYKPTDQPRGVGMPEKRLILQFEETAS